MAEMDDNTKSVVGFIAIVTIGGALTWGIYELVVKPMIESRNEAKEEKIAKQQNKELGKRELETAKEAD